MTTIREWQTRVHALACEKGWWDGVDRESVDVIAGKLALIHSEVSEALEELRCRGMSPDLTISRLENGKPEGFGIELADVVIRCLDLNEALGIDLEMEIARKHAFNKSRPRRHGGKAL